MAFGLPTRTELVIYLALIVSCIASLLVFNVWWFRIPIAIFLAWIMFAMLITNAWTVLIPYNRKPIIDKFGTEDKKSINGDKSS